MSAQPWAKEKGAIARRSIAGAAAPLVGDAALTG
jgi:hypothetical protein